MLDSGEKNCTRDRLQALVRREEADVVDVEEDGVVIAEAEASELEPDEMTRVPRG